MKTFVSTIALFALAHADVSCTPNCDLNSQGQVSAQLQKNQTSLCTNPSRTYQLGVEADVTDLRHRVDINKDSCVQIEINDSAEQERNPVEEQNDCGEVVIFEESYNEETDMMNYYYSSQAVAGDCTTYIAMMTEDQQQAWNARDEADQESLKEFMSADAENLYEIPMKSLPFNPPMHTCNNIQKSYDFEDLKALTTDGVEVTTGEHSCVQIHSQDPTQIILLNDCLNLLDVSPEYQVKDPQNFYLSAKNDGTCKTYLANFNGPEENRERQNFMTGLLAGEGGELIEVPTTVSKVLPPHEVCTDGEEYDLKEDHAAVELKKDVCVHMWRKSDDDLPFTYLVAVADDSCDTILSLDTNEVDAEDKYSFDLTRKENSEDGKNCDVYIAYLTDDQFTSWWAASVEGTSLEDFVHGLDAEDKDNRYTDIQVQTIATPGPTPDGAMTLVASAIAFAALLAF